MPKTNGMMLLNVAAVKKYIHLINSTVRPGHIFERVSKDAIDMINYKVKKIIVESLKRHSSGGKTFRDIQ